MSGDAFFFPDQAQKKVLGPDVVVIEPLRLVLGVSQDPARLVGELVEAVHVCLTGGTCRMI